MRKIIYSSKYYYVMGHKTGRHRGIADARACARAHRYSGRTAMPGDPMLKSCPQKNRWQGVRDPLPHVCLRCSGPPFSGTGYRIPCRCGNGFARFCSCVSRYFPGIVIGAGKRSRCRHPGRFFLMPWDKTGSRFHPLPEFLPWHSLTSFPHSVLQPGDGCQDLPVKITPGDLRAIL